MNDVDGVPVRDALIRQWRLIAAAIPSLDLETASRVDGWRNREVVAHLSMQPALLVRFLGTAGADGPTIDAVQNLSGTRNLADMVDAATREAAEAGRIEFATAAEAAIGALDAADTASTVTTLQGPIVLADYLVTRCVEAVVHGCDLVPPVEPDHAALAIAAAALTQLLARRAPELVATAARFAPLEWVDIATGRVETPQPFAGVAPLMS